MGARALIRAVGGTVADRREREASEKTRAPAWALTPFWLRNSRESRWLMARHALLRRTPAEGAGGIRSAHGASHGARTERVPAPARSRPSRC